MEVTYRMQDGFLLPNLLMPQERSAHLGKYAELRRQEIEQTAQKMVEQTVAQMVRAEGVTEELKATDPLRWTGLMNNFKHSAEEMVLNDLIYS